MTDELKFFDPETGKPLHRVPQGATIPNRTPYGLVENRERRWRSLGPFGDMLQDDSVPRFTRDPIAPPKPPLPTEPGYYLDKDGDLWYFEGGTAAIVMDGSEYRGGEPDDCGYFAAAHAPFTPVTLVPTETWDRLRVLDPKDKRDRVDGLGRRWVWSDAGYWKDVPGVDYKTSTMTLASAFGPLRFADEVSDR